MNTPAKNNNVTTPVQPNGCFKCANLATMPTTALGVTHIHPKRTTTRGERITMPKRGVNWAFLKINTN
jgi:hypothetical protein